MRKNKLIALIGTLTMAVAGLVAVSSGVSSKTAQSVNAEYFNYSEARVKGSWDSWTEHTLTSINSNEAETELLIDYSSSAYEFGFNLKIGDSWTFAKGDHTYSSTDTEWGPWNGGGNLKLKVDCISSGKALVKFHVYKRYSDNFRAFITQKAAYQVSFASNGGSGAMTSIYAATLDSAPSCTFTAPTGKAFDYWSVNGTKITYPYNITANTTLTANWKTHVEDGYYIDNFHTGELVALPKDPNDDSQYKSSVTLAAGDYFKVVKYANDSITDYYANFIENDDSAKKKGQLSGGGDYSGCPDISCTIPGTYTVYFKSGSHEIYIPYITYKVKYNVNGGTGTDITKYPAVGTDAVAEACTFTPPTGKLFRGWSVNQDGSGTLYEAGATVTGSGSTTQNDTFNLYAVYTNKSPADGYYVKVFGSTGRNIAMDTLSSGNYSAEVTLAKGEQLKVVQYIDETITNEHYYNNLDNNDPASARKAGQLSVQTSGDQNIVAEVAGTYTFYFNSSSKLIQVDAIKYTIVYNSNYPSGTQLNPDFTYNVGTDTEAKDYDTDLEFVAPTHTTFKYWSTSAADASGSTHYDIGDTIESLAQNETLDLYAIWEASASYTVTLHEENQTGGTTNITVYPGESFTTNIPVYGSYHFLGYFDSNNVKYVGVDGKSIKNWDKDADGDLYAHWGCVVTIVNGDEEYGSIDKTSVTVELGSSISENENVLTIGNETITATPNAKTETHTYSFECWSTSDLEDLPQSVTEDLEIYAWFDAEKAQHTITFVNTDERGGSIQMTYDYDDEHDVTPEEVKIAFGEYPIGREFVGLKNDPKSSETPYTHVVFDQDKTCYVCYSFYEASEYLYQVGDATPTAFTSHRDSQQSESYIQVYTATISHVTAGEAIEIATADEYDLTFDLNSNFKEEGVIRHTADNVTLDLRLIYTPGENNSVGTYHYEASLSGMPISDQEYYISVNGELTQLAKSTTADEYYIQGITLADGDAISAYCTQFYYPSLDPAVDSEFFTKEGANIICHKNGVYDAYLKHTDGGYDQYYLAPQGYKDAVDFAEQFLDEMSKVCKLDEDGHVNTVESELQTAWNKMAGIFGKYNPESGIPNTAKTWLSNATPVEESTNVLERFASSYNYIYGKYSTALEGYGGNFLGRDVPTSASNKLFSVNDISSSTWIIATVAILGVAAVGVFFIYRKRKEN